MGDVAVRRPVNRAVTIGVAGVVLGLLAFAADSVDGPAGQIVIVLVSSGLAWGGAALVAGRTATSRRAAVTGATAVLVSATLVYYLLILLIGRQWSGGPLADGSSADGYALRSLVVTTAAWLLISMVAGPVLGLLGRMTLEAPVRGAALAAGVACGLLSGQGWYEAPAAPPWRVLSLDGPDAAFARAFITAGWIEIILPLAVLVWLATAQRLWRAWPVLLVATIATATVSALCWHLLRTAANQLG